MEFIDSATERSTAATDAILALIAVAAMLYLHRIGGAARWKTGLWIGAFALLVVSATLGALVHGLKMSDSIRDSLWHPLNLSLGLLVALFLVAVIYDLWGERAARRSLPIMLFVGSGFFVMTLLRPGSFMLFIIYEAVAMLFALGGYFRLALRGRLEGAWMMAAGITVTLVAAGVQAGTTLSFTFVWRFDHNGAYHLIQILGIVLLMAGLRSALRVRR